MTARLVISWTTAADATDAALARVAAAFAQVDVADVRVVRSCRSCGSAEHGKPQVLRLDGGDPVHVSLSRSEELAVLAVTDAGPVGVDVELVASPETTTWVRVESLVKATGHGLQLDPDSIAVTAPHRQPRLLAWPEGSSDSPAWMFQLEAPAGFSACASVLAAERPLLVPGWATLEG